MSFSDNNPSDPFADNPYQTPKTVDPLSAGAAPSGELGGLTVVGILLLILAVASLGGAGIDLAFRFINFANGNLPQFGNNPQAQQGMIIGVFIGAGLDIVHLICQGVVLVGSVAMIRKKGFNMAYGASIVSMFPCLSSCCFIGIPLGIIAFMQLRQPNTESVFRANERAEF